MSKIYLYTFAQKAQNMNMRTSTKIWIVLFIISTVMSLLLGGAVSDGIFLGNGISFNFSLLGYIGLGFILLNAVSFNILFFRFLVSQPFNRMLFFLTIPVTLTFAVLNFYLLNLNTMTDTQSRYIRQFLNVNETNNNQYLWIALAIIAYLVILFISFKFACRPLKKVQDSVRRLSSGRVNSEIQIGGSKQFVEIENSLNKINENFKEKKI